MKKNEIVIGKKSFPSVSIIIPVNKKYPHFKDDAEKMKSLLKQTETTLLKDYPTKKTKPLIENMYKLAEGIDYRNLSDGLGLFVSPHREKIVHFPFSVKEKVVIGKTFEIRDLVIASKSNLNYAVITISEKKVRVLSGINHSLVEEKNDEMPYNIYDVGAKERTRVGSFTSFSSSKNVSDQKDHIEKQNELFLMEIDRVISADKSLKNIPLIICAPVRTIGHFRNITKNKKHILGYVNGNFDNSNEKEIYLKISGIIEARQKEIQDSALEKLEEATGKKKEASGIRDVWKAAYNKTGRLLLVEKDYSCPATTGSKPDVLFTDKTDKDDIHYMQDAVDDVIELVLKYGGDVVFVENGKLEDYSRIALIKYF